MGYFLALKVFFLINRETYQFLIIILITFLSLSYHSAPGQTPLRLVATDY